MRMLIVEFIFPYILILSPLSRVWDLFVIGCIYKITLLAETLISTLPYPSLHGLAWVSLWGFYSFWVGLFGMGVWVIAHECGHQAFSESKQLNNAVGWVLHSGFVPSFVFLSRQSVCKLLLFSFRLGVPYHSWRISHAKHHAATCHMSQDQVFVPWTRSEVGGPPLDPSGEDLSGANVSDKIKQELWEALGDSPIGASIQCIIYLVSEYELHPYITFRAT
jgi:omega-6 fatty acid desaturase (delta-12 desaturase)